MTNFIYNIAYTAPQPNFIGQLVGELFKLLGGTGNYWLTVILFTLILKIITSPLDYWQRLTGRKNALKLERIKPQLEAVQKKYGDDRSALNMKQQELYKSVGYSPLGACLPMILTMVIMIFMFTGLNTFATYKQVEEYNQLENIYVQSLQQYTDNYFDEIGAPQFKVTVTSTVDASNAFTAWYKSGHPQPSGDSTEWLADYGEAWADFNGEMIVEASDKVLEYYGKHKEGFLWIQNIWQSDTPWAMSVLNSDSFKAIVNTSSFDVDEYDNVMGSLPKNEVNGYLVLPILAMVLMFFSQRIMSKNNQTGMPQSDTMTQQNKMMQWLMPVMFGVFGLMYTAAVSLYMLANSLYGILFSFAINWIVGKRINKIKAAENRPGYRR